MKVLTGLDILVNDSEIQKSFKGNIGLLCNNASVDATFSHAILKFKKIFDSRFIKVFGPQHGFSTDAQDNMIETDHCIHPYFNIPIYSLYSETRTPTDKMLEDIDHLFVDLQDIGCRTYTYIYTLTLLLEKCANKNIEIIVLDRPNPINGVDIEGNILEKEFKSFIGLYPIPMRHGMTIGEVAIMHQTFWSKEKANLKVIKMQHWKRAMYFEDTKLPWILPSPNLARAESTCTFPTTVLFEGTNLSEGRGTTQPLEIFGHPNIEPYSYFENNLKQALKESKLKGFTVRPITFIPTFHKQYNKICGGFQIHITDKKTFQPWRAGQFIMKEIYHYLGSDFTWKTPPYEYNYTQLPIDILNGTDKLRYWIENNGNIETLDSFEDLKDYKLKFNEIKLY
ncbi:DUF1343 domain-containing protein [Lutibacter sp. A80]|uniref:DUF1343 domain-containing protein n=1 Tax=Lutibacter sp. A80 TaxID=2918453 RepID=UPI001F065F2F|nr:DUF1343 domain-containing protein [Lutibacter sp. A80]UMB61988.1 DUF1343 domain-containing protein [Lutibacter sp. A80]